MAGIDDRFAGYSPAPLNHTSVDRGLRASGSAAVGGVKGAIAGYGLLTLGVGGVILGGALLAGAGIGAAIFLGVAATAATAYFGATFAAGAAVLGGLFGAAKGYSHENQRAGLDQSIYNERIAEAIARGAAQGQAMAAEQKPIFVPPQPVVTQPTMRDAAPAEAAPLKRDDTVALDKTTVAPSGPITKTQAGSPIQYDGTIDANLALAR